MAEKNHIKDLLKKWAEENSAEELLSEPLESEWPPYEMTPFAYQILNWSGEHLAVVMTRERAHAYQKHPNDDPRRHSIVAIYPDESKKLLQQGASIFDDTNSEDFEDSWRANMESMQIDPADIEIALTYYRDHPPKIEDD